MFRSASEAMAALADGDRSAFDHVYRHLHPIVARFCSHILGAEESNDATQEVLLRLFSQATRYRPEQPVEAWAITLARWECRTRLRRRQRSRESSLEVEHAVAPEAESRLMERAAAETLSSLPEREREVIVLALEDATPTGAKHRKRKQRAFARLRAAWRQRHGT